MGSSSSSSSEEEKVFTVVVSPVELVTSVVKESALAAELEALAKKFDMPLHTLVTGGHICVLRGEKLELLVREADVRPRV